MRLAILTVLVVLSLGSLCQASELNGLWYNPSLMPSTVFMMQQSGDAILVLEINVDRWDKSYGWNAYLGTVSGSQSQLTSLVSAVVLDADFIMETATTGRLRINGCTARELPCAFPAGTEIPLTKVFGQDTTLPPTTCTYTYSDWGACQPNNTQTRTVISSSPSGCVGTPTTKHFCQYVPPPPETPQDLQSPHVIHYFDLPENGVAKFRFFATLSSVSNYPLQISLLNQYAQNGTNSDLLVKFAGPNCEAGPPTMEDYTAAKAYYNAYGISTWDATRQVWNPARIRDDLYYSMSRNSMEVVEIYGVPDNPHGCYFIMVLNVLPVSEIGLRLSVMDADMLVQ